MILSSSLMYTIVYPPTPIYQYPHIPTNTRISIPTHTRQHLYTNTHTYPPTPVYQHPHMQGSSCGDHHAGVIAGGHRGRSLRPNFIEFNRTICNIQHAHTHIFKVNIGSTFTIFYYCFRALI